MQHWYFYGSDLYTDFAYHFTLQYSEQVYKYLEWHDTGATHLSINQYANIHRTQINNSLPALFHFFPIQCLNQTDGKETPVNYQCLWFQVNSNGIQGASQDGGIDWTVEPSL